MNKLVLSIAAAAALAASIPALAQQKAPDAPKATDKAAPDAAAKAKEAAAAAAKAKIPTNTFYKGLGPTQYLVKSRLIGQNVFTKDGQKIGDIEDVIVNPDNTVAGVIIGAGGFANIGDKKIGVRYGALRFETKDGKTTISMPSATKEIIGAVDQYEGSRTTLQKAGDAAKKAGDAAKSAAQKATEATKAGIEKAKEAVKGTPASAPAATTPAPAEKK